MASFLRQGTVLHPSSKGHRGQLVGGEKGPAEVGKMSPLLPKKEDLFLAHSYCAPGQRAEALKALTSHGSEGGSKRTNFWVSLSGAVVGDRREGVRVFLPCLHKKKAFQGMNC